MRIDPPTVFIHTIASLPGRLLLAWVVGSLGAITPILMWFGFEGIEAAPYQALLLPFYLIVVAAASGWWALIAIPLILVFAWRVLSFVRDEDSSMELLWLYLLPFIITIRASGDSLPWAALFAVALAAFAVAKQRQLPQSTM